MRKVFFAVLMSVFAVVAATAQTASGWRVVKEFQQKHFAHVLPPGNYSGIAPMGNDVYAMVSDKSDSTLLFNVRLYISRQTGELLQAEYLGGSGRADAKGLDNEAIVRVSDSTVVVASEGKCRLKEYPLDSGRAAAQGESLWEWSMPENEFWPNYVFESLAFDSVRGRLWTVSESTLRRDGKPATTQNPHQNVLRLFAFDWRSRSLHPSTYLYRMDMPTTMKSADTYVMGVSEMCALPDGSLLVLEREAFVPKLKLGAFCQCKLFVVDPSEAKSYPLEKAVEAGAPFVEKRLLTKWTTRLSLFNQSWANYEGMCLGPTLDNGDLVLLLVSDSQDGYAGVLRDWFKTIVLRREAK